MKKIKHEQACDISHNSTKSENSPYMFINELMDKWNAIYPQNEILFSYGKMRYWWDMWDLGPFATSACTLDNKCLLEKQNTKIDRLIQKYNWDSRDKPIHLGQLIFDKGTKTIQRRKEKPFQQKDNCIATQKIMMLNLFLTPNFKN